MASRNQFKKHAMLFVKNKERRIVIERTEDRYYISEGFSMLCVPSIYYDVLIRPLSPMFPSLENGKKAIREAGHDLAEVVSDPAGGLADIFNRCKSEIPANVMPFMYAPVNEKTNIRLVDVNGKLAQYNDNFITAVREYCINFKATADRHPVLKWEDEIGVGCLVMPVNNKTCASALAELRKWN